jgi:uncharacterized membrane protein YfcA
MPEKETRFGGDLALSAFVALLGLLAGFLIGAAGIGGVILVPALVCLAGTPILVAISGATLSYILTGLLGTLLYAKTKFIRWDMAGWLIAGAAPAALAGAFAAHFAPGALLELLIALLAAISGFHTLLFRKESEDPRVHSISNPALALAGAVTGFVSALTGTGGPLVLVPILLCLGSPVLTAIGLSQVIQLPVSLVATAGNFYNGNLDLRLGALLAVEMPLGVWLGSRVAHSLPRATLRRAVSLLLIMVGVLLVSRLITQSFL